MKLKTTLGTIMTLALILLIGATSIKTAFAKNALEISVGSTYQDIDFAIQYGCYVPDVEVLRGIDVTPDNKGVLITHNKKYNTFKAEFKKPGTYKLKFRLDKKKFNEITFKVIDFGKSGKECNFEFYKDSRGNDVLYVFSDLGGYLPNVNIKFGKKTVIKNANINSGVVYVFKKGYLEEINFNPKDIKNIKYEVVKKEYESALAYIDDRKVKDGIVTAIKLNEDFKGYEGHLTIGDCENGDIRNYSTGELYTIKLDKKASGEWIKLEKGIPKDRLLVTNSLYKPIKKKKK